MAELNFSQSLAIYLDQLRVMKNMTQEEFTNGIVSMRQYRRYLRGESDVAPYLFEQLSERLGLNLEYLVFEFRTKTFKEIQLANEFHNAVMNKDVKKVTKMLETFNETTIKNRNNLLIFKYASSVYYYDAGMFPLSSLVERIKSIINYPDILKHKAFSSTEIIILSSLLVYNEFDEKEHIVSILTDYINDKIPFISGYNKNSMLLSLYRIADYQKRYGNPKLLLDYAQKGIKLCLNLQSIYLLEDFYMFQALAYKLLNKQDEIYPILCKLRCVLALKGDEMKLKRYASYIKRDFNIDDFDHYLKDNTR